MPSSMTQSGVGGRARLPCYRSLFRCSAVAMAPSMRSTQMACQVRRCGGGYDHIGIYVGGGQFVHAPAWIYDSSWYGWVDNGGDYGEAHVPEGLTLTVEGDFAAECLAQYLTRPEGDGD